ncbi:MAG: phosphate signaling complex PhoU family protein, partial [Litorivicinaceae bacterium]
VALMAQQAAESTRFSTVGAVEVRAIGERVGRMLSDALTAFARLDAEMALQVARNDRDVDAIYQSALRSLATFMIEDPREIGNVLNVMWVLRALERIGDHATNVAEHIVYLVKGTDIRHLSVTNVEDRIRATPDRV